jgi:hypothetical protein
VAPHRPTRAVFALEELYSLEDEVARTSLALTGSPLDLFNDTVLRGEGGKVALTADARTCMHTQGPRNQK